MAVGEGNGPAGPANRPEPGRSGGVSPAPEASLGEIADRALRRITTAVVIAGAIIGLAIYSRPGPPRFQGFAGSDRIYRIDTRSGTVIGCDQAARCAIVLRRGQSLGRRSYEWPSRKREAEPAPAPALPPPGPAAPSTS